MQGPGENVKSPNASNILILHICEFTLKFQTIWTKWLLKSQWCLILPVSELWHNNHCHTSKNIKPTKRLRVFNKKITPLNVIRPNIKHLFLFHYLACWGHEIAAFPTNSEFSEFWYLLSPLVLKRVDESRELNYKSTLLSRQALPNHIKQSML